MAVAARVQRYGDQPFHGKVVLLAPTIDRQTRTARVKVRLENPDGRLMPGMLARVSFEVERRDKAVVVPYTAVVIETGAEGEVAYRGFVVADGKAVERTLAMGIIEGDQVEIRSGLGFGELLVTQGGQLLEKGHRVEIVERLDKDGKPLRQGAAPAESKQPASAESSSGGKR
jgi:RND family efflux transporter MFP subunit